MPLTRQRILKAAVTLADRDGLDKVSMRKLAREVGVEAMSLYNHVENKDDVHGGMVELVMAEIPLPFEGNTWRERLRHRSQAMHALLMEHPWAASLLVSRINTGSNVLGYVDHTLQCLREAGFEWPEADAAWNTLDSFVYGYTLQKLNFPFAEEGFSEAAEEHMDKVPSSEFPHLNELATQIMSGAYDGRTPFEYGLELILDGLERRV